MRFYLNKQAQKNGEHEVHTSTCIFLPSLENRIDLGEHTKCSAALEMASNFYDYTNGCKFCCSKCHAK